MMAWSPFSQPNGATIPKFGGATISIWSIGTCLPAGQKTKMAPAGSNGQT